MEVTTPLVSIIIPTYNHAAYLRDAISSCLEQTAADLEVLVLDDASTDDTAAWMDTQTDQRVRYHRSPERLGPSAQRNHGLDLARGQFVMFLDADDVIDPRKLERQLAEFAASPSAGWVLCDVMIVDAAKRRSITASQQYRYDEKDLGGWIGPLLAQGNFIPIMSPLVRKAAIPSWLRFRDDRLPEDWYFWSELAQVARVRYVPEVLAVYRHRTTGRSRVIASTITKAIVPPLRLNLGCGTPGTRSWHPIEGLVNLDRSLGWCFEDGLGAFADESVAGITISHALMYLEVVNWPAFLKDCWRVLVRGGVLRITEDDAHNPESSRFGGWQGSEPAIALTSAAFVSTQLIAAGFRVYHVTEQTTEYRDRSLCQAQHGAPPDVFFIEGVKS